MLVLPIKKKWFDMIASGQKTEEYRSIKPYWISRLEKLVGAYFVCVLKNGYSELSPCLYCWGYLSKGKGKKEWGAEENIDFYVYNVKTFFHSSKELCCFLLEK